MSTVLEPGPDHTAPAAAAAAPSRTPWLLAGGVLAALLVIVTGLYWQTAASMVEIWSRSETYAHGFVILPLSLYMIWTRREMLARLSPRPAWWPLPLLALTVLGWALAQVADVAVVTQLAFVAMVVLAVVTAFGTRVAWAMSFPLAYLFFAVPMGGDLEPLLMDITAVFTVDMLRLTGIPVYVEGRFLTLPTGNWEVAEACSGIRYLIASLALGTLYAYLTYSRIWKRVLFIGLSILVPILANGLRAYGIVMIGHLSDMKLATGVDHIIYGWVFFGVVMLLLFWLGSFFRDDEPERPRHAAPAGTAPQDGPGMPRAARHGGVLLAGALLLLAGPGLLWASKPAATTQAYAISFPQLDGAWAGPEAPGTALEPVLMDASAVDQAQYRSPAAAVTVLAAHYASGSSGELITYGNQVYDEEAWLRISEARQPRAGDEGPPAVREIVLRHGGTEYVVWWWYDIGGTRTVSRYGGKLVEAWKGLTGQGGGSSLVAVATPVLEAEVSARRVLDAFLADHGEALRPADLVQARPQP